MKIFEKNKDWEEKVNFVDENNVLVGYDMQHSCCEHVGWFISEEEENEINTNKEGVTDITHIEDYVFDRNYFKEINDESEFQDGGMIRFKLINDKKSEENWLYLHIFNSHNGYYSHGFEFKDNDVVIESNSI